MPTVCPLIQEPEKHLIKVNNKNYKNGCTRVKHQTLV